ncbi:hypothetical protein E0Z10_g2121 [Xylaria hypoxylon]|uniref:F-box domain-containing protein n=1 Tax=Xylaria hypoxylon TaxID=37992 RepID=A0A4Z0YRX1_9PEZI|nr:hypothetical protein E0Z10_g2121 [Xylaria hypoxylon]
MATLQQPSFVASQTPSTSSPLTPLTHLPAELLISIISYLANRDIKNLRLTNAFFPVFLAIADDETFRKGITEIVWDDALLTLNPDVDSDWDIESYDEEDTGLSDVGIKRRKGRNVNTPEHTMRSQQVSALLHYSWMYYQVLLQRQEDVITSGADVGALRYGLHRFPALKRITISPAAYGWLYTPLYETPMIRAFPRGFNYHIPRGWPCVEDGDPPPIARPWEDDVSGNKWRGFRLVTREMVKQKRMISGLLIDAHYLNTGLNCRIFDLPCDDYDNFSTIIQQPGFTRLQLELLVGGQEYEGWPSFRNGLLRQALCKAMDLEHMTFWTDIVSDPDASSQLGAGGSMAHHIPLRSIFPTDKWP